MRDRNAPLSKADLDRLDWDKGGGLIPAIVQDRSSGQVLMLGYMNRDSLAATLDTGLATFWSRSRGEQWRKGDSSGNRLAVTQARSDCDDDALLILADATGPTCHNGTRSCFAGDAPGTGWIARLERIIAERAAAAPEDSYTARLLAAGPARIAQKVGEEGVEAALAGAGGSDAELIAESADLVYHLTVLLAARGLGWSEVVAELARRHADQPSSSTARS